MRVTDKMTYNQVTDQLQKNRGEMGNLQNQAATQKRITKPSDDPAAAARVLVSRTEERGSSQFIKNINVARSYLEFTDQSLSELSEALIRAKELAIQQASDAGASEDTRRVTAAEIDQIYAQAVQIGNRKLADRYVFAGHQTTTAPFDMSGEYAGDDGEVKIQVNKDAFVSMNIAGDKVFLGKGLAADGLIRQKKAVPKDAMELHSYKVDEENRRLQNEQLQEQEMAMRAPSSAMRTSGAMESIASPDEQGGINILKVLKDFEISLTTNDKLGIQEAIDTLDASIAQVVNARASVGARIMGLNAATDTLQKSIVDNKTTASQLEDVDLFQVVSDINKTDSTLKATLETSSKVMNQSLLDFLR